MKKSRKTNYEIPYSPRALQAELHSALERHRWAVIVMHRRAGKTVLAINHILRDALLSEKTNPRYFYIAPTYRQAKAVAWDYVKEFTSLVPAVKFNETELRADFPNGGRVQLLGAEKPDSLRGIYADGVVIDETADMPESLFPEIVRPALSDRRGYAIFIGTPRGHNAFYELYQAAQGQDDWHTALYKASETGILDADELAAARSMMTADQYEQEYECSWVANVPGSIFGSELQDLSERGRICSVPHDPSVVVQTFWDLGIGDATSIWFVQIVGRSINVIDYYEARGEGLDHYAQMLAGRGYTYGTHHAPHDIEVRELGSGKSRREIAWDLGINFRVVPKLPVEDGIHAARMLLPRCWFDAELCKPGLEALRHYHRAYNERMRSFRPTPVHDWSSHAADAWRYCAVGIREDRGFAGKAPQIVADSSYNPLGRVA